MLKSLLLAKRETATVRFGPGMDRTGVFNARTDARAVSSARSVPTTGPASTVIPRVIAVMWRARRPGMPRRSAIALLLLEPRSCGSGGESHGQADRFNAGR